MARRLHVIGAGLAGLSAALHGLAAGWRVTLHEAAGQAGGRCRSYHDPVLGRLIDNGNHLLLSGNRETMAYLRRIGASGTLTGPDAARFPFLDLAGGARWTLRPGWSLPWSAARRAPGTRARDYLPWRLLTATASATVAECLPPGTALERVWRPLLVSALNTPLEHASARLAGRLLRQTLLRGEAACRPLIAADSLDASLIDPALATLARAGADIRFHRRLTGIERSGAGATALLFDAERIALDKDAAILAVSAPAADSLLDLGLPLEHQAIVNGHFRLETPFSLPGGEAFLALVGGTAEWLFRRGGVISTTTSAANGLAEKPAEQIAALLWADIVRALELPGDSAVPSYRIVKEKRATPAQTPAFLAAQPRPSHRRNLALAGDWVATGLPCTVESAVRSGRLAVEAVSN
ncbi:hydroxysqualene dehydroxylase HpnE [Oceanibaculum pacificum]|uniref:Amine oxidase domain-containing protein n=1 Tax=Oceanibaculum pacificum TaxID=580166 RepID=A0A154VRG7_9PROT|nr:hydroxysqualene dehydroxylase HpnE [Oceanibaculum pacificum]KZD03902.1 hypothetical protein AUP43_12430 [Oceanibaculum pacificum]